MNSKELLLRHRGFVFQTTKLVRLVICSPGTTLSSRTFHRSWVNTEHCLTVVAGTRFSARRPRIATEQGSFVEPALCGIRKSIRRLCNALEISLLLAPALAPAKGAGLTSLLSC